MMSNSEVAVITGSGRGIEKLIADRLGHDGYELLGTKVPSFNTIKGIEFF